MNKCLIMLIIATPIYANAMNYKLKITNTNPKHSISLDLQNSWCLIAKTPQLESSFKLAPLKSKYISMAVNLTTSECSTADKAMLYTVSDELHHTQNNTFSAFITIPTSRHNKYEAGVVSHATYQLVKSAKCSFNGYHYQNCYYKNKKSKLLTTKRMPKLVRIDVNLK